MDGYREIPLTALRTQLGQVVDEAAEQPTVITREGRPVAVLVHPDVLRSDLLPPGYFDERARAELLTHLDERLRAASAEEAAAAADWAAHAFGDDEDGRHHAA